MKILRVNSETISILVQSKLYSESVLYKCFYWYGSSFEVTIVQENDFFNIELKSDSIISSDLFDHISGKVKRDLLDYKTRQIIADETRSIKELLIAKAFSAIDDYEADPPGKLNDSLGFKLE